MGNRFSRRRDAPASSAGTLATEEKTEAEPTTHQDENSEITQIQEAVETEELKTNESEVCSPKDKRESGSKEAQSLVASSQNDAELELAVKEAPPPVQTEPFISAIKPECVTEALLAPKSEPQPPSHEEADAEPISEPAPTTAEPLEHHTGLLSQEALPESFLSSPLLIDSSVPEIASAPPSTPASLNPDELPIISAADQREGWVEPTGGFTLEPEKETSEFLEKPMEVEQEAIGCMKTPENDVEEENVREVLQNLELRGNDLLNDLIPSAVMIPGDTPITDVSTSIELM